MLFSCSFTTAPSLFGQCSSGIRTSLRGGRSRAVGCKNFCPHRSPSTMLKAFFVDCTLFVWDNGLRAQTDIRRPPQLSQRLWLPPRSADCTFDRGWSRSRLLDEWRAIRKNRIFFVLRICEGRRLSQMSISMDCKVQGSKKKSKSRRRKTSTKPDPVETSTTTSTASPSPPPSPASPHRFYSSGYGCCSCRDGGYSDSRVRQIQDHEIQYGGPDCPQCGFDGSVSGPTTELTNPDNRDGGHVTICANCRFLHSYEL